MAEDTSKSKVEKLVATFKASQLETHTVRTQLEQQISDLQARLQPSTAPEVCDQHAALITDATTTITGKITQGATLLELAIHLWNRV